MRDGLVEQVGPPMEVYRRPATIFVAGFVGSPAMNFLPGELGNGGAWIGPAGWSLSPGSAAGRGGTGSAITLGVRPHDLAITAPGQGAASARVDVVEPRGSELLVHLRLGAEGAGQEIRVVAPPEPLPAVESVVGLRAEPQRLHWFDTRTGRRIAPESP
jgi:ABC-type sugar transport system ATPase subunit